MKPLPRGWLSLSLAMICLLTAVRPAPAQFQRGMNNGNQPNWNNAQNNAAASAAAGVGTGMMLVGIGMIIAGLALTGGVVYLAIQGQKSSYGGSRRSRRSRRQRC